MSQQTFSKLCCTPNNTFSCLSAGAKGRISHTRTKEGDVNVHLCGWMGECTIQVSYWKHTKLHVFSTICTCMIGIHTHMNTHAESLEMLTYM